jgi:hypothetical protein
MKRLSGPSTVDQKPPLQRSSLIQILYAYPLFQRRLLSKIIFTGYVGRSQRSLKPNELDSQEEMDRKAP